MATFTNIKYTTPKRLTFTINNAELSTVNAIRRIMLSEIPTVGFYFDATDIEHNDIKITKNTCALHNEFLAHRVSLVPLCFNENDINEFDASKFKFVLKKQNNTFEIMNVTTKDFEVYDDEGKKYPEEVREKILPKNPITKDYILLTKLKPNLYDEVSPPRGESVEMECFPTVNIAMKHGRWSPVSQCCYGNTVDAEKANTAFEEAFRSFESQLGRTATKEERETQQRRFNTLEVFRHFKKNKFDEANVFDFKIESESGLRPAYLFFKACKILIEKVNKFQDNLRNKQEDEVKINKLSGVDDFYMVEVKHENYTLMNVLQNYIYNICFRETKGSANPIEYIGFTQPHPLDDVMVLKIKLHQFDDVIMNKEYVSNLLLGFTDTIQLRLKAFVKEWLSMTLNDIKNVKEVLEFQETL